MGNFDFGERLRVLRTSRGLTQVQLAEKIGMAKQTIFAYESGANSVSLRKAVSIADFFGVTVGQLAGTEPLTVDFPEKGYSVGFDS